jgi:thiol-disulfide isomerase/thioredoxin
MSRITHRGTASAVVIAAALLFLLVVSADSPTADFGLDERVAQLNDRITALEEEVEALTTDVRAQHPDPRMEREASQALAQIHALIREGNSEQAKERMDEFMGSYHNTKAGKQAASLHRELGVVGRPTPEQWSFESWFQGENDIDLDADGPTILVFWETWCPHCRREVPKLQKVYDDYSGQGLQVLGVSQLSRGGTQEKMMSFLEENELRFPMAKDNGSLSAHFGVAGIPAVAVVKEGKVVWRGHPARIAPEMLEAWVQ